jgi:hypothetical protein
MVGAGSSTVGWRRSEYVLRIPDAVATQDNHQDEADCGYGSDKVVTEDHREPDSVVTDGNRDVVTQDNHGSASVVALTHERGDPDDKNVVTVRHPNNRSNKRSNKEGIFFIEFERRCEARNEDPIPADDAVFAYAQRINLPREFVALAWREFERQYRDSGKRYTDWRRTFSNAVRGDWFKLWHPRDNGYVLSTRGVQAQREYGHA